MMAQFWSCSDIADAPGMHPHLAFELRDANRTGLLSHDAAEAGYVVAVNGVVIPTELPIAVPPNNSGISCPVYLREPTPWEFHKLERAGVLFTGESYIFMALPKN